MEWNILCDNLREILELEKYQEAEFINWKIDSKEIIIKYYLSAEKIMYFSYLKSKFLKDYKNIKIDNELNIVNEKYYEIPISIKNEYFPIIPRYDRIIGKQYKDEENNIEYKIDKPSEKFLMKIIELKIKPNSIMMLRRLPVIEREYKFKNGVEKLSIFDLLRIVYRDCITLKIFSMNKCSKAKFEKLADAFIFNINYNMDIGIRQTYDIENVHERRMNNRFRNENIDKIAPPRRTYKRELIEQYNMASISEDPCVP